jgi:hypothetical protein
MFSAHPLGGSSNGKLENAGNRDCSAFRQARCRASPPKSIRSTVAALRSGANTRRLCSRLVRANVFMHHANTSRLRLPCASGILSAENKDPRSWLPRASRGRRQSELSASRGMTTKGEFRQVQIDGQKTDVLCTPDRGFGRRSLEPLTRWE